MSHTVREHDGMKVLVIQEMGRREDADGKLLSVKDAMAGVEIVHAKEIAKYYGIPLRSVGQGDSEVHGVWHLVHSNQIGQRVAYNTEETKQGDRNIRAQRLIKNPNGGSHPLMEEKIVKAVKTWDQDGSQTSIYAGNVPLLDETDDGMYVRLSDLLEYAPAMGWKRGGGLPGTGATKAHAEDTNSKLDKLIETVQALAQIQATQLVSQSTKGVK